MAHYTHEELHILWTVFLINMENMRQVLDWKGTANVIFKAETIHYGGPGALRQSSRQVTAVTVWVVGLAGQAGMIPK